MGQSIKTRRVSRKNILALLKQFFSSQWNNFRLLPRWVFLDAWRVFGLFVVGLTAFLLLRQLRELVELAVNQELAFGQIAWLLVLSVPGLLLLIMPFSLIGAVFVVVARHSRNSELTALMASGVSLRNYAHGFFLFGFSVALLVSCLSLWLAPLAFGQFNALRVQVARERIFQQFRPGQLNFSFPGTVVLSGEVQDGNQLHNVHFMPRVPQDVFTVVSARRGFFINTEEQHQLLLVLEDGEALAFNSVQGNFTHTRFERLERLLGVTERSSDELKLLAGESNRRLQQRLASNALGGYIRPDVELELFRRWLAPITCLAFVLASVPMSVLNPRSGKSSGYLRAVMLIVVYYLAWLAFKDLVKARGLHVSLMLIPSLLVGSYGLMRLRQLSIRPWV